MNASAPKPGLIGPIDLARELGVSACTLARLRRRGLIPYVRLSRQSFRYDLAEVRRVLGVAALPPPLVPAAPKQ